MWQFKLMVQKNTNRQMRLLLNNLPQVTELELAEEEGTLLFKRNSAALKLHAFLPIQKGKLTVKTFSTSAESEECCVTMLQENMTLDDAKGFETCMTVFGG
jgi:hypothetical protein